MLLNLGNVFPRFSQNREGRNLEGRGRVDATSPDNLRVMLNQLGGSGT